MGIPVGAGFNFFVAGRNDIAYRVTLEAIDVEDRSVFVSVACADGDIKEYSLAVGGSALYLRRSTEAPLDIRLQKIKIGGRGDLIADFNFYSADVYFWRKLNKES